ncbi:TadE-like protein [Roseovarius mucosus DSM 17069]|uniref:TadE-like protein n=1 Tax=Roseovarius mucosus DSM 17069 TaxID=1288298 RepID=A0A0A0HFG2_9RHOB|nr:TadE family protein [Roseovarius mucosus]KGM86497.1 TadE-like protein [Roseovarius mucosus DSM 17069]
MEFVILFPALILFLIFIVGVTLYLGIASDVQQAVQRLARASVGIQYGPAPVGDLCARLSTEVLDRIIEQSPFLQIDNVVFPTSCADQPDESGTVTLTLVYNVPVGVIHTVADLLGSGMARIERSATIDL